MTLRKISEADKPVNEHLVKTLENLLLKAKSGELKTILYVFETWEEALAVGWSKHSTKKSQIYALLGKVYILATMWMQDIIPIEES